MLYPAELPERVGLLDRGRDILAAVFGRGVGIDCGFAGGRGLVLDGGAGDGVGRAGAGGFGLQAFDARADFRQAQAVGRKAVQFALKGLNATMPVIRRIADSPYRWKIEAAPLENIANAEKTMPDDFIRNDGFGITEAARRYLQPLIRGEAYPPYARDGLPKYVSFEFY